MKLYTYWRSSSAYRVRIALNLKGIEYESVPVHLLRDGGEQRKPEYLDLNPLGLVPTLVDDDQVFIESLAIVEYLDEKIPEPMLLPRDRAGRARVRAMADLIACEIQPLNNSGVMQFLAAEMDQDKTAIKKWYAEWIARGFIALENLIDRYGGIFCFGDTPTMADVFLVPQMYNAIRFDCDLSAYPRVRQVYEACQKLDAFVHAAPENQADAE